MHCIYELSDRDSEDVDLYTETAPTTTLSGVQRLGTSYSLVTGKMHFTYKAALNFILIKTDSYCG